MTKIFFVLISFLFVSNDFIFSQPEFITADTLALKQAIIFLASDSLKGRAAGTAENEMTAFFIANAFKKSGLKPFQKQRPSDFSSIDKSLLEKFNSPESLAMYFQKFTVVKSKLKSNPTFKVNHKSKKSLLTKSFNNQTDFFVQYSGQTGLDITTGVVFCGFGIDSGPNGYNDFLDEDEDDVDIKGKAVVIWEGYPHQEDSTSVFARAKTPYFINPLRKAETAKKLGAVALIVIEPRREGVPSFEQKYDRYKRSISSDHYLLPSRQESSIPIIFISRKVGRDLLSGEVENLDSLFALNESSLKSNAFIIKNRTITFGLMFDVEPIETRNVVGILPGTDSIRSSECIVIGSHYDHVGIGKYGAMNRQDVGKIHYGADDNASGTACLMELAAILSEVKLKRSVVFVGFNAEEMGLLGSAYFTNDQPAFPLRQTVAMLNLDMVGRNEDSLLWIAGGFYSPDLMKIIEEENKKVGFVLLYNTGLLNFASDQGPFLRRNIPAAFFFSGLHSDYHTPADTHQKLNYTKMGRVTNLAARCAARLANTETLPKYYEIPLSERIALIKESSQKLQRFRPIKKAQQEALPGAQNEH